MKFWRYAAVAAAICLLGASQGVAAEQTANKCHMDAVKGMVCEGEGGTVDPGEVMKPLDQNKIDETLLKPAPPSKPVTGIKPGGKEDLEKIQQEIDATEEALKRMPDAYKEIDGLPREVREYQDLIAKELNKRQQDGTLGKTMKDVMGQSGGGSPLDFLKSLVGGLGLADKFKDPRINPASKFGSMFNAPVDNEKGGTGYNPWANGGNPPVDNIPFDENAELCIKYGEGGAKYQGKAADFMKDSKFGAIMGGPPSKVDPNLVKLMGAIYADLKACNPGKDVCMISWGSVRSPSRCGKQSNHCVNHNKYKTGHQIGKSTAIDVQPPSTVSYEQFRDITYCAVMNHGGGEVGDENLPLNMFTSERPSRGLGL